MLASVPYRSVSAGKKDATGSVSGSSAFSPAASRLSASNDQRVGVAEAARRETGPDRGDVLSGAESKPMTSKSPAAAGIPQTSRPEKRTTAPPRPHPQGPSSRELQGRPAIAPLPR